MLVIVQSISHDRMHCPSLNICPHFCSQLLPWQSFRFQTQWNVMKYSIYLAHLIAWNFSFSATSFKFNRVMKCARRCTWFKHMIAGAWFYVEKLEDFALIVRDFLGDQKCMYAQYSWPMRCLIGLFLNLLGCGWLRIGRCCGHFVVVSGNILVGCGCHLNLHPGGNLGLIIAQRVVLLKYLSFAF